MVTSQPNLSKDSLSKSSYLTKLDAVRGIAILGVFLFHFYTHYFDPGNFNWQSIELLLSSDQHLAFSVFYLFSYGWVGVPIFFVLSGFVNHWSYLNTAKFDTRSFFWRRFWRIYPPYLLALCYFAFLHRQRLSGLDEIRDFLAHVFLVHNFSGDYIFGFNNSFWSIAVEAQFYLLYPLVLYLRSWVGLRRTLMLAIVLSLTLKSLVIANLGIEALNNFAISEFTLMTWFQWILGAYLAEQYFLGKSAFPASQAKLFGLIGIFFASTLFQITFNLASSLAALIAAISLEAYINTSFKFPQSILVWLTPLGLCSYSFYLWHEPFVGRTLRFLGSKGLPDNPSIIMTLGILVTFCLFFSLSWLLYQTVEKWSALAGKYLWKFYFSK